MKQKLVTTGLLALAFSGLTAVACVVQVRVACPNDTTSSGIKVCIDGVGCDETDDLGIALIDVPGFDTYTVRVDPATLPTGATLSPTSQKIKVETEAPPVFDFVLGGSFCSTAPPPGPCWLTGGGTIGRATKGTPNYSFGGVVYPGCHSEPAEGGNWNVVDHATGLHFQGQKIIVDECSGVETKSPKVNVNIIDFHGIGIYSGIAGNETQKFTNSFVGRAIDNLESGSGSDKLYLKVTAEGTTVMQIGTSADAPATIATGNLQIHTTGCNK